MPFGGQGGEKILGAAHGCSKSQTGMIVGVGHEFCSRTVQELELQISAMRPLIDAAVRYCQQSGEDESLALREAYLEYEGKTEKRNPEIGDKDAP